MERECMSIADVRDTLVSISSKRDEGEATKNHSKSEQKSRFACWGNRTDNKWLERDFV